jgi:hypothetical protein
VVTIVLESLSPNYKRWRNLVLLMLCRYALDDHILSNVTNSSVYWARLDNIVVTWILDTLSPKLHEIVREPTEITCQAWLVIQAQFLSNESRVLQLDARFCAFKQGDLSVNDYCRRMKGMDDDLCALSETDTDCHLVLNLLHGLNKRFNHMKIFIKQEPPCPQAAPPPPAPNPNNNDKGKGKGKGKDKNNGSDDSGNNNGNNSRGAPACPSYNPCTGTISMWPGMHRHTTGLPVAPPLRPCQFLHRTNSRSRPLPGYPGRSLPGSWTRAPPITPPRCR